MTLLADLSDRARAAARDADVAVLAEAARHVLDTAACVASGSTHPLAARWVPLLPEAPGGVAALGAPGSWAVGTAVEIDATLAHVDEFDALHGPAAVAPGAVVVPTALHVGRAVGASGADVLRAVVAGYEAVAEASLRFGGPALYAAGWWPTALFGALGAAAATALLLDLDGPATTTALALATAPLGGLLSADDLGDAHYLLCGRAAAHGVGAARAAAAGLTASATLLDAGPLGAPRPPSPPGPPHLLGTALKSWPCARPLHTALAALAELGADGAEGPVRIALPTAALRFVTAERRPSGPAEAAASAAVAVAGARAGRARDPGWYRDPGPAADVVLGTDPDLDAAFPARWGAVVTVGGASRRVLVAPGDPDRPLSAEALRAKASRLLGTDPADDRISAVLGLAGAPRVGPVLDGLLGAAGPGGPAADRRGTLVPDDVPAGSDEEARWRARPGGAARP